MKISDKKNQYPGSVSHKVSFQLRNRISLSCGIIDEAVLAYPQLALATSCM